MTQTQVQEGKSGKRWLTLNQHGKFCLRAYLLSIGASDLLTSQLDYLFYKDLVDYATNFGEDVKHRNPLANHALTDLGIHTAIHYFPKYTTRLQAFINQTK